MANALDPHAAIATTATGLTDALTQSITGLGLSPVMAAFAIALCQGGA